MSNQRMIDSYYEPYENPAREDEPEEIEPVVITSAQYKAFLDLLAALNEINVWLTSPDLSPKTLQHFRDITSAALAHVKGQQ